MKKTDRKRLDDALDKALAPPRKMPRQALDSLLDEYDEPSAKVEANEDSTGVPEYRSTPAENTQVLESKITGQLNTDLKEKRFDDDAALTGLIATLKDAVKQVTGREVSSGDQERWRELGEVLVTELKIAAARTTVSSVPAFLAEHLRRRLWKIDKKQAQAEGKELPDARAVVKPNDQTDKCPDCGGTGWWYPEGPERGVAKCKHERLESKLQEEANQSS